MIDYSDINLSDEIVERKVAVLNFGNSIKIDEYEVQRLNIEEPSFDFNGIKEYRYFI